MFTSRRRVVWVCTDCGERYLAAHQACNCEDPRSKCCDAPFTVSHEPDHVVLPTWVVILAYVLLAAICLITSGLVAYVMSVT